MGLFDPPYVTMAKYGPVSIQAHLAAVRIFAEDNVPAHLSSTKRALLVAMAMGGWLNINAQAGSFDMPKRDFDKAQLLYMNCARMLGNDVRAIGPIMLGLIDRGLLPDGVRDFYSR